MNRILHSPTGLIAGALLFLLAAWGFKSYETQRLERTREEVTQTQRQVRETLALKRLWEAKGIDKKIEGLKKLIPAANRKKFLKKKRSLEIRSTDLEGRQLNRILSKIGALPLQVKTLRISRKKDRYTLECRCKW